jgi:ABC-type transport system involved in cytochrome bd biosynthesis fused ATPase/permease subunit
LAAVVSDHDPVRERRARIDRLSNLGRRIGYGCMAVAVVAFFIGFAAGYSSALVALIVAALVVGSVTLLPAIILGYAVKAAEREDRERGT